MREIYNNFIVRWIKEWLEQVVFEGNGLSEFLECFRVDLDFFFKKKSKKNYLLLIPFLFSISSTDLRTIAFSSSWIFSEIFYLIFDKKNELQ